MQDQKFRVMASFRILIYQFQNYRHVSKNTQFLDYKFSNMNLNAPCIYLKKHYYKKYFQNNLLWKAVRVTEL